MDTVFQELTLGCQQRYNSIRRKAQFFSTYAGGVIEALRESGFRLSNFKRHNPYARFHQMMANRPPAQQKAAQQLPKIQETGNMELEFEQRDRDRCKVLIIPYRTDLAFLSSGSYLAQLGLELSRYTNDPEVLRQAVEINARSSVGSFIGGGRLPKLYLDSPSTLQRPGTMTFELQGARLVVAMNVIVELNQYRVSDFDLDIEAIRKDFAALFYGLEKYLCLLIESFGGDSKVAEEATYQATPEETPLPHELPPPDQPVSPSGEQPPSPFATPGTEPATQPKGAEFWNSPDLATSAAPEFRDSEKETVRYPPEQVEAELAAADPTLRESEKETVQYSPAQVEAELAAAEAAQASHSSTQQLSAAEVQEQLRGAQVEAESSTMQLSAQEIQEQLRGSDTAEPVMVDDGSSTIAMSAAEISKQLSAAAGEGGATPSSTQQLNPEELERQLKAAEPQKHVSPFASPKSSPTEKLPQFEYNPNVDKTEKLANASVAETLMVSKTEKLQAFQPIEEEEQKD